MPRFRPARLPLGHALLAVWLAAGGVLPTAAADQRQAPRLPLLHRQLCPLEERLFADAADGHLDEFSLLAAALVASGVEKPDVLRQYLDQQAGLVDELRRAAKPTATPRQQAQAVFEFMHGCMLVGGYQADCTDLRAALDDGRFNCVSASVLFNCLAGEVGLAVCGLESPGHTASRLKLPDGPLDVETTYPGWFRLIGQAEPQAEPLQRPQSHEVSQIEMLAMIYYNRGVELLAQGRFAQAAAANAKALLLDPDSATAWGNLLATINNWAIALGGSGHYAEAVELLGAGLRLDPRFEAFGSNYLYVHHEWVEHLCRCGRYAEALHVLGRAAAEMPDQGRRAGGR
jgi:tetratricopeptide (TPR) repeat protein